MSERLYYTDSYTTEFDANVVTLTQVDGQPAAILDRTYFYPTSGGQQHDTGTLGGIPVVDVQVGESGDVLHVLAETDPEKTMPLDTVRGIVDWPRRFDHMQQHTGQHLLSAAFTQRLKMETVSVHFGSEICMLELDAQPADKAQITDSQLAEIENWVNDLVLAQIPVLAYSVDEAQIGDIPLRRPPKVSDAIRVVEIQDFDWSACGGTHVHNTGEIGPVKLLRTERIRGHSRVHFVCGHRALVDYRAKHDLLTATAGLLDTHPDEVPDLVARQMARLFHMAVDYAAKIGFTGQFLIEPKPKEPTKHQYDYDAATVLNFLQTYDLSDHFKLNIEANHATLAGHSFAHELTVASDAGKLGSMDINRGDLLLGWDTDQFPTDLYDTVYAMLVVLRQGGLGSGGLNFDAKPKRGSIGTEDLFYAHIGGMDTFARALLIADQIIGDGLISDFVAKRYHSWSEKTGKEILAGNANFEQMEAYINENGEPVLKSGRQDYLENVINSYI